MAHPRLAFAVLSGLLVACAATPAPAPRARAAPPERPPDVVFADRAWGEVDSPRFFVSVPLPDFPSWHVDDTTGRWLVATHLASKSILWVRAWREGSVVGHTQCEAAARPWRPDLFGKDPSALADRRPSDAPPGYDAEVGFAVRRQKEALAGVAIFAAANVRRCLVMAYATRAEGPSAPEVIAGRLAFVAERIFARASARTVEDRVPSPAR